MQTLLNSLIVSQVWASLGRDCSAQITTKPADSVQMCSEGECCAKAYKSTADANIAKDGTTRYICIRRGTMHYREQIVTATWNALTAAQQGLYTYTDPGDSGKYASYVAYC